jgi:uncharacterized peroxidase-related enzyme
VDPFIEWPARLRIERLTGRVEEGIQVPHIDLPPGVPGIRGLLLYSPATAKPMGELAEYLMRGPNTLTRAEREMIATYVSHRNDCHFCHSVHGAIAAECLGGSEADYALVDGVRQNFETAAVSAKMKALLTIAGHVQEDGKRVTTDDVDRARREGATDTEIHDTVLIAAAFCMFNRYVDGLATWQPHNQDFYREAGKMTSELGYVNRDYSAPVRE